MKKIKEQENWYKLDNAAKLYPAIISKKDSGVFRVSIELKDEIIPKKLQQALEDLKPRFPTLYVKLKPGLFWYYFENNDKMPILKKETSIINEYIDLPKNNDYRFTVFYFNNRISLECFHSLCDGFGAMEFLKAIVYRYLELLGNDMSDEKKVITIHQKYKKKEIEDSFEKYYTKKINKYEKVNKAYHIKDIHFPGYSSVAVINGKIKTEQLIKLAKSNNVTLTQYLATLLAFSINKAYKGDIKKPINVCIPINIRKFFDSKTLRNFSLFFYTSIDFSMKLSFDDILKKMKEDFNREIDIERLQSNINYNVSKEKNIFMKICPLFLKNIVLRIASNILGNSLNTMTISNLGNIDIPESMKKYVKNIAVVLSGNYSTANNMGVASCNGTTVISYARTIYETSIEKIFFNYLTSKGIDIEIESNMLENYL
jgi:hypothetical protein